MRRIAPFVMFVAVLALLPAQRAAQSAEPADQRRHFAEQVRPLLHEYCGHCHAGPEPKSDLALDQASDHFDPRAQRALWLNVVDHLREGDMPPEGEPRPAADQVERLADWLQAAVDTSTPVGERNPGHVTLHRLNRTEYNNTIRDLLGIEFRPADDFPADDLGYGFDNIGDVLSVPPILLEKYLNAAEAIAERTIVAHPRPRSVTEIEASRTEHSSGGPADNGGWRFASEGELRAPLKLPADGEYVFKIEAYGDQAGPEPARMSVKFDQNQLQIVDVKAVQNAPGIYEVNAQATAGDHRLALAFINDYFDPKEPNPGNRDRNLVIQRLIVEGPLGSVDLPASHRRLIPHEPAAENRREFAHAQLRTLASRAFRRPATDAELQRLLRLFETGEAREGNFAEGMQLALQGILVSPHFLFRVELDPPAGGGQQVRDLNDFELASRLSYFLWSSMPDRDLFTVALKGKLHEPAELAAQARRLLQDPKARALVDNFAGQWLQLRNLANLKPDAGRFPGFDESLRAAMREETERFFAAVVEEDRSVLDFLDADFTFLNERLARHYGIPGVNGPEFRRVTLSGEQRGGVLAQASVLTVTSNPTRTSPVKRGKWVLENLLGAPPPAPPPGVPELKESREAELQGSLRERMVQHREKAECAVCHNRMDPIGFGLENYDAIGAWRTHDGAFAIDPSGTLPGGRSFAGPSELKQILKAKDRQFVRCLTEKLLTYALGRGLESYDRQTIDEIVSRAAADNYRFSSLLIAVIQSDPFVKRAVPGVQP